MTYQAALTIVTKIKPGETDGLQQLLKGMNENPAQNDVVPVADSLS